MIYNMSKHKKKPNLLPVLPKGKVNLDDAIMIHHLLNDEVFKESIAASEGPIRQIWADWKRDRLMYEFKDGSLKESVLSKIVEMLKNINYMKEFEQ